MKQRSKIIVAVFALLIAAVATVHFGLAYRYAHVPLKSAIVPHPFRGGQAANGLVFSPDGKTLFVADAQAGVSLWTLPELRCTYRFGRSAGEPVSGIAWTPDTNTIALGDDFEVHRWDVRRNQLVNLPTKQLQFRQIVIQKEYWKGFYHLHFVSPSGNLAAGADPEGDLVVWDIKTGQRLFSADASPPDKDGFLLEFCGIAFSPDDRFMALASFIKNPDHSQWRPVFHIVIRDIQTKQTVQQWQWQQANFPSGALMTMQQGEEGNFGRTGLTFSPDGSAVAAADATHAAVWDVKTGRLRQTLSALDITTDGSKRLVFFHKGHMLAGCGWGRIVPIWSVDTGKLLQTFYANYITMAVAVSPDDKLLATGGQDEVVITSAETGKEVTPDNELLSTGKQSESVSGSIALWDISRLDSR